MNRMENLAILASAGTGKTFSLAMRFIRLLHEGVVPSAIVAVTFTNKAAGEILDKITGELIRMSEDSALLRDRINSGLLPADMTTAHALALLRKILLCRERLQIGTIDSFFLNIIQAFPLECGVAGSVTMIEETDKRPQQTALLRMIREGASSENERRELREAVKQASFGAEERSLRTVTEKFIDKEYPRYLACPNAGVWGNPVPIWPEFKSSFLLSGKTIEHMMPGYQEKIRNAGFPPGLTEKFLALPEAALENIHKRFSSKNAEDLIARLSAVLNGKICESAIQPDGLTLSYNRKNCEISGELLGDTLTLIRHLAACEFARVILRTRAVFKLLDRFNIVHTRENRAKGLLSFQDIPYLLGGSSGPLPASSAVLEERMDAKTEHYLLDEFQDTSDIQWDRMENLIDEVVQDSDPDRPRSFFYVGDVKQSIYQWREGNPRLFGRVARRYSPEKFGERGIRIRDLNQSFRSGAGILEAVNRVFETNVSAIRNPSVLQAVKDMKFLHHTSAPSAAKRTGSTILFEMKEKDAGSKAEAIYRLIQSLHPFREEEKLSVGILVRRNDTAAELAEFFRRFNRIAIQNGKPPLPVTVDGKLLTGESMACVFFLQLLTLAAHPGDRRAKKYLEMLQFANKPLDWNKFKDFFLKNTSLPLPETMRNFIREHGFSAFTRRFLAFFQRSSGNTNTSRLSDFDSRRMQICLDAAREADRSGELSPDGFLTRFHAMERRESSVRDTIQIMTVHKAKGLDFDVVILAGLSGRDSMDVPPSGGVAVAKNKDSRTEWISFLPANVYAEMIPGFRMYRREKAQSTCYENCCTVYVGMTRARRGLYLFLDPHPAGGKAYRPDDLLRDTLSDPESVKTEDFRLFLKRFPPPLDEQILPLACIGDPLWQDKPSAQNGKTPPPSLAGEAATRERNFLARLAAAEAGRENRRANAFVPIRGMAPSGAAPGTAFSGATAFSSLPEAAGTGTRIHEILSRFEWYGSPGETERFLGQELTAEENSGEIGTILRDAFRAEAVRRALSRPENRQDVSLWREKSFLALDEETPGRFISGCFDRVTIISSPSGNPARAEILDYKSDRLIFPEAFLKRHSHQMNLYRKVLSGMLDLPETTISCTLLALRPGLAISVPFENTEK